MDIKALYFDMDNTLHDFSRSGGIAMGEVYKHIAQKHGLPLDKLKQEYERIRVQAEKDAFFDGRTSTEYRAERFTKLLGAFNIYDKETVKRLLEVYAETLEINMKPFDGVTDVLGRLSRKKPLYIVTEGPGDAQRRAIDILGLPSYFQDVFISGEAKKIKETGELFRYALEQTGCKPHEVVLIGDSYERDVLGGLKAGLHVIWFNRKNKQLNPEDKQPSAQIHYMLELEKMLKEHFGI